MFCWNHDNDDQTTGPGPDRAPWQVRGGPSDGVSLSSLQLSNNYLLQLDNDLLQLDDDPLQLDDDPLQLDDDPLQSERVGDVELCPQPLQPPSQSDSQQSIGTALFPGAQYLLQALLVPSSRVRDANGNPPLVVLAQKKKKSESKEAAPHPDDHYPIAISESRQAIIALLGYTPGNQDMSKIVRRIAKEFGLPIDRACTRRLPPMYAWMDSHWPSISMRVIQVFRQVFVNGTSLPPEQ